MKLSPTKVYRHKDYNTKSGIDNANEIATALVAWLESSAGRIQETVFKVSSTGEYQAESVLIESFRYQLEGFELVIPFDWSVKNRQQMNDSIKQAHKAITIVLLRLVGVTVANRMLKPFRERYKLGKIHARKPSYGNASDQTLVGC